MSLSQISPTKEFLIVWNGADPSDTTTLYVRAVVQNAKTLAVLATVNLTDRGNHLFSASYITPPDPNTIGNGLQIIITITVYTDLGYTIPSQNYARESRDYLVKTLISASQFWGPGGDSFDPKEIKKLLKEVLAEAKPVESPSFPVAELMNLIKAEIDKLPHELPEDKEVDLSPLQSGLDDVRKAINILPTLTRPVDIIPLAKEVRSIQQSLEKIANEMKDNLDSGMKKTQEMTIKGNEKIVDYIAEQVMSVIEKNIKSGAFKMTLFDSIFTGDETADKKKQFLDSLKAKYTPKKA